MKVKINGQYITFFDEVIYSLTLDSVASAFSFVGRYNPNNPLHRKTFKPLSYAEVEIFNNQDKLLLTGTIINHSKASKQTPDLWRLSGYSKAGVLEDSNIPYSQYPLESNRRSLADISNRLINPFGLSLVIDPSVSRQVNTIFENTVAEPSESIKDYLAKLAAQRNVVLSHTEKGDLLYFRPDTKKPPKFRFNKENTLNMNLGVQGQGLHSEIAVLRQPGEDSENLSPVDTVKNTIVNSFRPAVKILSSGTETDTKDAANNQMASELKNITISISLYRVLDLLPGDIVEVQNDEIFLSEYTRLMVNNVTLKETTAESNMTLNLLLPESFTGEVPKDIFK